MRNAIRIRNGGDYDEFGREFERLSGGIPWPPRNAAEWTTVMLRGGFNQEAIDEILAFVGSPGVEPMDITEFRLLKRHYFSVAGRAPKGWMPFSQRLLEGLRVAQERSTVPDGQRRAMSVLAGLHRLQEKYLRLILESPGPVDLETIVEQIWTAAQSVDDPRTLDNLRKLHAKVNAKLEPYNLEIAEDAEGQRSLAFIRPE
jgi:hypothetical protein